MASAWASEIPVCILSTERGSEIVQRNLSRNQPLFSSTFQGKNLAVFSTNSLRASPP